MDTEKTAQPFDPDILLHVLQLVRQGFHVLAYLLARIKLFIVIISFSTVQLIICSRIPNLSISILESEDIIEDTTDDKE